MALFARTGDKGEEGLSSNTNAHDLDRGGSAVSVVFARNTRPTVEALRVFAERSGQFSQSFDPGAMGDEPASWCELLVSGLAFDCTGLQPGHGTKLLPKVHSYGIAPSHDFGASEAITIAPGPHLVSAGMMFPVVRSLALLGALLAELPGVEAIVWHAARSYNGPDHYRTGVLQWIEGGAFPGLGLTALAATAEGGIASEGLSLFTGQELTLAPELAFDRAEGAKLALRLIHWLVENGRVDMASHMTGPSGETLLLDPVNDQQIIKVSKS